MTRRDATPAPDQQDTPADPDALEPSDDEQQPDDQQPKTPSGDDTADDGAGARDADQADEGDEGQADEKVDWKAKHDATEQKRRDMESRASKAETRARELDEYVPKLNSWWKSLIEREAPELHAKILADERKQSEGQSAQRAGKADSYQVINGVYREGDKAFGDYLTTLVEDAGVTINPQSLAKHKRTYDAIKGGSQNGDGNGAAAPRAGSATAGGNEPPRPPRVPGAGRSPTDIGERPWKPGEPFDVRGNLSKGMSEAARRRQGRR